MGAKEPIALGESASIASATTNGTAQAAVMTTPETPMNLTAPGEQCDEQSDECEPKHLPNALPPPQVVIIPATQASTVATNAARKIRRALSMPRNPFRWSRKYKAAAAAAASNGDGLGSGGGLSAHEVADSESNLNIGSNLALASCVRGNRGRAGSIVSLNSYQTLNKEPAVTSPLAALEIHGEEVGHMQSKNVGKIGQTMSGDAGNETGANAPSANSNRIFRRSSFRKFLNRIAQHVTASVNVGSNLSGNKLPFTEIIPFYTGCWRRKEAKKHASFAVSSASERVPPIGSYQWPADQTPGVMGLKNHGNTCFMNAVLQCLSHTDILAEYFVLDQYKADLKRRNKINSRKFGTKGELTEQLANVLKALWTCKNESDHSTSFKAVVDRYGAQFRSSTQHDAQEFLFWLLDKVHEDLNTATKRRYKSVKNNYGRPDEVIAAETLANHIRCNNSFVQAVFQAQFRSSLTCPRCKKQSNTFDPFHCISVQLPQLTQQTIFVTVVYLKQQPRQLRLGLTVPAGSPIVALREQLQKDTGIASERMVLVDVSKEGFTRVFYDTQPVATLIGLETIFCIEVPATPGDHDLSPGQEESAKSAPTTATAAIGASETKCSSTETPKSAVSGNAAELLLLVANVRRRKTKAEEPASEAENSATDTVDQLERFGAPFSMRAPRDCSYMDLQKTLLREMASIMKPEVFSYATPLNEMFKIRLQDPSADPDTYLEQVEHPLLTEMIDLALAVLSTEAGPPHIKLLLEWQEPQQYFADLSDTVVEHESVARLLERQPNDTASLTLEQCLEHYTKAETLSAEDAWRCPHCQQYLPVVKTLGLWSLPDILVVHFKRFRQHQAKGANAAKLTTMVTFPLNAFDMSPHLARGPEECGTNGYNGNSTDGLTNSLSHMYRPSPWRGKSRSTNCGDSRSSTLNSRDNRETRYDLYAVCYHQGDTLETGHYTAACKNPYDHQWYKFDDQRVSKVSSDAIETEIINNEAYMLFYQRRGTGESSECSGSSSNSSDHWISRIAPPTQAPTEKLTITGDKAEKLQAELTSAMAASAKVELVKQPEKPQAKPVEIPKPPEVAPLEAAHAATAAAVSVSAASPLLESVPQSRDLEVLVAQKEPLAQLVVQEAMNAKEDEHLACIEDIDFADADGDADADVPLLAAEKAAPIDLEALERSIKDHPFVGDPSELFTNVEVTQTVALVHSVPETAVVEATLCEMRVLTIPAQEEAFGQQNQLLTNGHAHETHAKSPLDDEKRMLASSVDRLTAAISPSLPAPTPAPAVPPCAATAAAAASPTSTSVRAPSTIPAKFNGEQHAKEALLAGSLRTSNSSSIIGDGGVQGIMAHSHEFQLSQHQRDHWNGSRSSVSAVENGVNGGSIGGGNHPGQSSATCLNLRHSFSTSSNYKLRECNETLTTMLRNSANACSKDTLIFIDQQNHHHRGGHHHPHHHHHHHHHHHNHHHSLMEDEDDTFMGSRSLWISPVTPHKLITVSPKN